MNLSLEFLRAILGEPWALTPVSGQPLARLNSFGIGGAAGLFCQPTTRDELARLFEIIQTHQAPWFIIGKGTNLICKEEDFEGVLIRLAGEFEQVRFAGPMVTVGAGLTDTKLAVKARNQGLKGAEFLVTIPGSLGGAVFQNAGAHGLEMADLIESVECFEPNKGFFRLQKSEMALGYRCSRFQESGELVLFGKLRLEPGDKTQIQAHEKALLAQRKETQIWAHTFGSIFKNPKGQSAWALIDQAGLRGKQLGQVRISPKHANFAENLGGGRSRDLIELIKLVQSEVFKQTGFSLVLEAQQFPPE
ncbi:MAG: UDP-N-acetylenolpyruvoylglucosamine reductase [Candidatus Lambdaproteobacteria bacterium RIFOXYD12_FULL_49_8]|uniref:UDP-N-acetylenolpyruvoylglucosamine reductase n=1 Tax=Candidatus Lambdaproteobacteria bacterium RIFOXYD2_FULL_50_16 TaxID=1817772 RepID=A0A1F6G9R7_9PROT|nr:MAG: UDP-N-acetylenolpyruvoylglucosamine reductase [Candidatus Lambdaproteobacteria bacterium RIFOXYD2_FULL_50_16]OGG98176.1 MAG: UDP-N-acetylenolpyruvoylglucosamine reductase [Candidatus Lambdaproteobacteria bacterium RIFOXYD12_FULL_49_8]